MNVTGRKHRTYDVNTILHFRHTGKSVRIIIRIHQWPLEYGTLTKSGHIHDVCHKDFMAYISLFKRLQITNSKSVLNIQQVQILEAHLTRWDVFIPVQGLQFRFWTVAVSSTQTNTRVQRASIMSLNGRLTNLFGGFLHFSQHSNWMWKTSAHGCSPSESKPEEQTTKTSSKHKSKFY